VSRATTVGAAALGVLAAALAAVAAPLWTYTVTLAVFGVPHVLAELRYIDGRFGPRVRRGLAHTLTLGLAGVVALRVAAAAGLGTPEVRATLELGLGLALGVCVVPSLARRRPGLAVAGGGALLCASVAASQRPLEALVWFALLHNLTPVGLVLEATRGARRRAASAVCAVVFGVLPASIAAGVVGAALAAAGLPLSLAGPPGVGSLEAHLGAFVAPSLHTSPLALDLFRAAAFLQCMHYAAVLHVLPRLAARTTDSRTCRGGAPRGHTPLCWPREGLPTVIALALATLATFGFVAAFADTRLAYAVLAAVHAWLEVPVLLLAVAVAPGGSAASPALPAGAP